MNQPPEKRNEIRSKGSAGAASGPPPTDGGPVPGPDFIRAFVQEDLESGKYQEIATRFPPEPNGYLHVGHAKAMSIDFGIAEDFHGHCNLRFDDTNPAKEEDEYVQAIIEDVHWLGFDFGREALYASDYFGQMYEWAEQLIRAGKAYVDDSTAEQIREQRGTLTEPGQHSPWRDRPVEENLDLFRRMKAGEFPDGSRVLRARIDMASPNINLRDPVMYRILHASHHRTGDRWNIYPMYDWAHGLEDSIERISHSLCDLGYEDHRPLYDWFLIELGIYRPRQIEFARLKLSYTMLSKRRLLELVRTGRVSGWDDPRMPTLRGMRRRGYPPEAIRNFCERIGVAKRDSLVDIGLLEHCVREDLNRRAPRVLAVLRPLRVVIENYPPGQTEEVEVVNNPEDPSVGTRRVPFSGVLYIERDDFREVPPKGFFRLSPGTEVRLRAAYYITCREVIKDAAGEVVELRCTYDPASRGGSSPDGRRVKGTLHWVSAAHAVEAEVRLYDLLFTREEPDDVGEGEDFTTHLNPNSCEILRGCKLEPSLRGARGGDFFQFERVGYFCVDSVDSRAGAPVFNRTVSLKDSWAKVEKAQK